MAGGRLPAPWLPHGDTSSRSALCHGLPGRGWLSVLPDKAVTRHCSGPTARPSAPRSLPTAVSLSQSLPHSTSCCSNKGRGAALCWWKHYLIRVGRRLGIYGVCNCFGPFLGLASYFDPNYKAKRKEIEMFSHSSFDWIDQKEFFPLNLKRLVLEGRGRRKINKLKVHSGGCSRGEGDFPTATPPGLAAVREGVHPSGLGLLSGQLSDPAAECPEPLGATHGFPPVFLGCKCCSLWCKPRPCPPVRAAPQLVEMKS